DRRPRQPEGGRLPRGRPGRARDHPDGRHRHEDRRHQTAVGFHLRGPPDPGRRTGHHARALRPAGAGPRRMSVDERRTPSWLADWCGWVLAGMFALTPLVGWLAPLGFAPLVALAGLLTLPAIHLRRDDWSTGIALVVLVG